MWKVYTHLWQYINFKKSSNFLAATLLSVDDPFFVKSLNSDLWHFDLKINRGYLFFLAGLQSFCFWRHKTESRGSQCIGQTSFDMGISLPYKKILWPWTLDQIFTGVKEK